jgi:hypothetical protein
MLIIYQNQLFIFYELFHDDDEFMVRLLCELILVIEGCFLIGLLRLFYAISILIGIMGDRYFLLLIRQVMDFFS